MTLLTALSSRQRIRAKEIWDTVELDAATLAVTAAFPGYGAAQSLSLNQIIKRLEHCVMSWDWADLKVGDIALAVKGVFSGEVNVTEQARAFLHQELAATTNPVLLGAISEVYLEFWERGTDETVWISSIVRDRAAYLPRNWARCFEALPELLEQNAPELLAGRMAVQKNAYTWLLSNAVAAPHSGELIRMAHLAWLAVLPEPRGMDEVDGILAWMLPSGQPPLQGSAAARSIEKLLQPWLTARAEGEIQKKLLDTLIDTYGDPRNHRADFWSLVSAHHRKVLVRWLAGQSMDALLSIITRSTANHMWPPRHAFWKGLYDRGLIDEAWVALSPSASADANAMYRRTGDAIYTMTSRQIARSRKDTCLLIMRIGRYTVVEGSHNYRLHVFLSSDPNAPDLYEDEYDAEAWLLEVGHRDTCTHDPHGQWIKWAERRLLR